MPARFTTEHQRNAEYSFDPADIIIRPELNGRVEVPEISSLKDSILRVGQLQAVIVRMEAGKPVLIAGFSRWRAITEINLERIDSGLEPLKIRCRYFVGNEQDGYVANYIENHERKSVTVLDDAHQIATFANWGWSTQTISQKLNVEERIVRERLAIATATPEVQDALKRGRMKPSAAACIAKLASDRQRQILEKSPNKITTRTISEASGKRRKPTAKELRTYIETTRDDTTASHTVREFCDRLVRQMSGEEPLT
jgi:ParB-like chromosome segregation protein Spo0J